MIDMQIIRTNPEIVKQAAINKNVDVDIDLIRQLDTQSRDLTQKIDALRHQQKQFGKDNIDKARQIKEELKALEEQFDAIDKELQVLLLDVPNIPSDDTPIGGSEAENVITKKVGQPRKYDFAPKNHWELAQLHDLIDKERAAKVSGARFAYIKGDLVRLQFALIQFVMDQLTNQEIIKKIIESNNLKVDTKPFMLVLPPAMIKTDVYKATGRLNSQEVTYKLEGDDLWLNASAEHSLCPMYQNEIVPEAELPIRYLGYTTAFRREAGTYGKDMEGIFRMHQFDKLEMESFSTKETALEEHLFLVAVQEYIMQQLEIPYQVLLKCTIEIGIPNARGVDIEAWMAGQNKYRETHTADYMSDFQARRLNMRVRRSSGQVELMHTNDATAITNRALIAALEHYQQSDGSIHIPDVLVPFFGRKELHANNR